MLWPPHFALITAYGDIKERLGGLERENATLRRRSKSTRSRSEPGGGGLTVCVAGEGAAGDPAETS